MTVVSCVACVGVSSAGLSGYPVPRGGTELEIAPRYRSRLFRELGSRNGLDVRPHKAVWPPQTPIQAILRQDDLHARPESGDESHGEGHDDDAAVEVDDDVGADAGAIADTNDGDAMRCWRGRLRVNTTTITIGTKEFHKNLNAHIPTLTPTPAHLTHAKPGSVSRTMIWCLVPEKKQDGK